MQDPTYYDKHKEESEGMVIWNYIIMELYIQIHIASYVVMNVNCQSSACSQMTVLSTDVFVSA